MDRLTDRHRKKDIYTLLPRIQHALLYTHSTNVKEGCVLSTGTRTRTLLHRIFPNLLGLNLPIMNKCDR